MADISEEEKQLLKAFKELKVTPKADTPEELATWLKAYSSAEGDTKPVVEKSTTVTVSNQQPRLSIFYGDTTTLTKGEATYDQWRYELTSLMYEKSYKETNILQAIRRSVKGEASRILMRLGPAAGIIQILEKLDSVYGVIDSEETLLAKFYSARQREDEDITSWSCRLEDILNRAVERKLVEAKDMNDMLRSMFWTGMRTHLKDISGYKFEAIKDFDRLRVEMRKLEQEHIQTTDEKKVTTLTTAKSATEKENENLRGEMQELKAMVASLSATVTNLDKKLNRTETDSDRYREAGNQDRQTGYQPRQHQRDNKGTQPPYYEENRNEYRQTYYQQGRGRSRGNTRPYYRSGNRRNYGGPPRTNRQDYDIEVDDIDPNASQGPLCYKCRQRGHFQWQCTTRTDHSQRLN